VNRAVIILVLVVSLLAAAMPAAAAEPAGPRLAISAFGDGPGGEDEFSKVITTGPAGEDPQTLLRASGGSIGDGLSWSADGNRFAFPASGVKSTAEGPYGTGWPVVGLAMLGGANPVYPRGFLNGGEPLLVPDGQSVVFSRLKLVKVLPGRENLLFKAAIWSLNVERGSVKRLTRWRLAAFIEPITFSLDGSHLISNLTDRRGPRLVAIDLGGGRNQRLAQLPEGAMEPAYSPDGTKLAFVQDRTKRFNLPKPDRPISELVVADADGSGARPVLHVKGYISFPRWDPSGSRIAFVQNPAAEGTGALEPEPNNKVMAINADGTCLTRVFADRGGADLLLSRALKALTLAAALTLLLSAPAAAAIRYAAPGGTGKDPCANPARPCTVFRAADESAPHTSIRAGDVVELAPGTYYAKEEGEFGYIPPVQLPEGVTLRGATGKPRPLIVMPADSFADSALYVPEKAEVANVEIRNLMDTAGAIDVSGGTIDRVIARSTITSEPTCYFFYGTVRNSACIAAGGGPAIGTNNTAFKGGFDAIIRNSTLVATGPGSVGMQFVFSAFRRGMTVNVDVVGTLIAGEEKDVVAKASPLNKGRGAVIDVNLRDSGYATVETEAMAGGKASVTPPGGNGNVKATPLLARDNLHQLPDSPTVDGGAADGASGDLDVDGQPRAMGASPDIGADELDPLAVPVVNSTPNTRLRPEVIPLDAGSGIPTRFSFASSEVGSRLECKLDHRPYRACVSPYSRAVGPGRHVFRARAIDPQGLLDPTPATYRWRVRHR
jgi:hypothetical protein